MKKLEVREWTREVASASVTDLENASNATTDIENRTQSDMGLDTNKVAEKDN